MKSLVAAIAAASILLLSACTLPSVPSTSDGVPDTGIQFSFISHDITDTTNSMPIEIILKASALNPDLLGGFEEPDTGVTYPFRDPVTRVDLPVLLTKHTPYGAPIYFPPGEIINFTITANFHGHYGDVVICLFRDMLGREIGGTRQTGGIYDQVLRNTSTIEGPGTVTCTYSGTAA
jgi:hypothetical protein